MVVDLPDAGMMLVFCVVDEECEEEEIASLLLCQFGPGLGAVMLWSYR